MALRFGFFDPLRRDGRLAPLLVMIACIMMGSGLVSPILALYAQTFGVGSALVGTLVTLFGVGRLVVNLPAGYLSQRIGRRPLLAAGPLIVAVSSAGAAMATDFSALLAWRFVQGVGSGIYMTASLAALADISPSNARASNMALYQAALQLGASIGPGVGGYLAHWFGYAAPFWAYMAVGLAASLTGVFSFEDTLDKTQARKPLPSSVSRTGMMTLPFTAICLLTGVVFFTRVVTLFQILPQLGQEVFDLDVGSIGAALTLCALMNFAMLPAAAPLIERFGARTIVVWSTFCTAIGLFILFSASGVVWYWFAVMVLGIAGGIGYPAISSFTIACLPRERYGPGMGMQRTFGDVGFVFGPVISGALDDATGSHTADVMLNVSMLALAAVFFHLFSRGTNAATR